VKCHDFREMADSYLSDELLVETNHDVIRHLESCADCRRELAARRELRSRLRQGFQAAPDLQMNEEFASSLQTQLREIALRRSRSSVVTRVGYIAIAASLVIVAALGFRALQQRWRSQNPQVVSGGVNPKASDDRDRRDSGSALSAALAESAVGDHRDCALHHRLKERPIDLDEAGRKFDRAYIDLVNAVMAEGKLPAGVELVAAHSCVFKGQRFGHVILKYHGELVSVLVTNIDAQDDRALTAAHETIGSMQLDGFQLAYFKTRQHAVSIVSSLSDTENLSIAQAVQPSLSRHIRDAERAA
jgi:anti-sigma factor RsiW